MSLRPPHCHSTDGGLEALAPAFLTQSEAAALLRLSERTLERYRLTGTGPTFVKLGRRVVYRAGDLLAFAQAHTYRSTSEFQT